MTKDEANAISVQYCYLHEEGNTDCSHEICRLAGEHNELLKHFNDMLDQQAIRAGWNPEKWEEAKKLIEKEYK